MKDSTTKSKAAIFFKKLFIIFFWLLVWQIAHVIVGRDLYIPSPLNVINRLFVLLGEEHFWKTIYYSLYRVILGLFLSILLGSLLGILAGLNKVFFELLNPMMKAIKATPVISFIIVALIWFSSHNVPIFICFLMCFPLIWTNTVTGINNVDRKLIEMANVYGLTTTSKIKNIYIPSIKPYFTASIIMALGLSWKVSVAAEVLSHPRHGIGSNLHSAKAYLDTELLFAWTLVVIGLSFIFEGIFSSLIKKEGAAK